MKPLPKFYTPVWPYQGFQLVKRPDTPNYYIVWCPKGSGQYKRKSTKTRDLAAAQRVMVKFVDQRARQISTDPDEVKLLDCLLPYVKRKVANAKGWPAERTAEKHWIAFLEREGLVYVADLTIGMQELYATWRRDSLIASVGRCSNATINREFNVMRAALRQAEKHGQIDRAPFIMNLANPRPRERVLTQEEHLALLDACTEPHLYLFVMLATHTLQRPGAIFELRTGQVNLDKRLIDFHRPGEHQTCKRRAVVPISDTLYPHLKEAIRTSLSGYVVEYKGARITHVKRSFATACRHAGIEDATPYVLRRTGATLLAAAGVPLRQIAGMLGHTTTNTTEYHYAKHAPEYMVQAKSALDEIYGASQ